MCAAPLDSLAMASRAARSRQHSMEQLLMPPPERQGSKDFGGKKDTRISALQVRWKVDALTIPP